MRAGKTLRGGALHGLISAAQRPWELEWNDIGLDVDVITFAFSKGLVRVSLGRGDVKAKHTDWIEFAGTAPDSDFGGLVAEYDAPGP